MVVLEACSHWFWDPAKGHRSLSERGIIATKGPRSTDICIFLVFFAGGQSGAVPGWRRPPKAAIFSVENRLFRS